MRAAQPDGGAYQAPQFLPVSRRLDKGGVHVAQGLQFKASAFALPLLRAAALSTRGRVSQQRPLSKGKSTNGQNEIQMDKTRYIFLKFFHCHP
jgi:hypothetical protein